jgi:GNAT superfamily N-acetyltransferase
MTAADRDLDGALLLSQAVRWPYRRDDWSVALALGHGVLVEADGRIMASALWWPYGDGFATCGIIIVSPDMQGRGLGRILMESLLTANSDRCILLNSTQEGHRLYEAFGFRDAGTVHQHQAQTPMEAAQTPLSGNDSRVRAAACCTDGRDGVGGGPFLPFGSRLHAAQSECCSPPPHSAAEATRDELVRI